MCELFVLEVEVVQSIPLLSPSLCHDVLFLCVNVTPIEVSSTLNKRTTDKTLKKNKGTYQLHKCPVKSNIKKDYKVLNSVYLQKAASQVSGGEPEYLNMLINEK